MTKNHDRLNVDQSHKYDSNLEYIFEYFYAISWINRYVWDNCKLVYFIAIKFEFKCQKNIYPAVFYYALKFACWFKRS